MLTHESVSNQKSDVFCDYINTESKELGIKDVGLHQILMISRNIGENWKIIQKYEIFSLLCPSFFDITKHCSMSIKQPMDSYKRKNRPQDDGATNQHDHRIIRTKNVFWIVLILFGNHIRRTVLLYC